MPTESKYVLPEQFLNQMTEALSTVNAMTARIDERVKTLVDKLSDHEDKLQEIVNGQQKIAERVTILESKNGFELKKNIDNLGDNLHHLEIKVAALEIHHQKNENRWTMLADFVIKLLWAVAACVVIYKLGFVTLPLP